MAAQNSISDPERWTVPMAHATALIIDDSTELRSLLESILPYGGYRTISASTGEEGLNLALRFKPDLAKAQKNLEHAIRLRREPK